jgi:hypothetical protein
MLEAILVIAMLVVYAGGLCAIGIIGSRRD